MKKRPGLETSSPAVSFFLISPLFLNTSYSPSAILDYDWHFSYMAYIRERPKQEPAGRKMGKHFPKFFIKKVSGIKSTSGFCCRDLSLSYLFRAFYYFCISTIEFSLCICHYTYSCSQTLSQPIKAFST